MKKNVHLGLCCLLSGLMITSSMPIQSTTIEVNETSQDGRTGRILSSVGEVVEGLVKLIKNPHEKANVLHNVGKMLAGIMNVAAGAVQKNTQLSAEEMDAMVAMIRDMDLTIDPATQDTVMKHAMTMHNYLRTLTEEEIDSFLRRVEDIQAAELSDDAAITDAQDLALQTGILGSLHQMIHELFAIIQNPENPQLIGQNIADILGNIMNVASQAIKYEYMTSKNAEETVALYIDTFSTELTKKITHLMLQTALNIRGETRSRSCCKTNCCPTSCCKSSCGNSSGCCRSNGCKPCCRTMPTDDEMTRSCCNKCNNSCSKCCNRGTTAEDEATRACCSCSNSCGKCCRSEATETMTRSCCNKCNNSCNKCCNRGTTAEDEATRACCSCSNSCGKCCRSEATETMTRSCCNKCNNSCGKCCNRGTTAEDEATRACCSCSNSCGKCCRSEATETMTRSCCNKCNNSCGKCCNRGTTAEDEATRACCSCSNSCSKCCNRSTVRSVAATLMRCSVDCTCSPCECTPDHRSSRCGCNKPKPTTTREVTTDETKTDELARCGCNKPKPTTTREVTTDETKTDELSRCGCNKPKPTITRNASDANSDETQIDEPARCGCNKPKPTTTREATTDETKTDELSRCGCGKPKTQPTVTQRS